MIRPAFRAFLLIFCGCATLQEAYSPTLLGRRITIAQNYWRANGAGFHLPSDEPAMPSPELQAIVDRLVYVSPLRDFPIRTHIVSDMSANAFTNGNHIYVHTGMLYAVGNDTTQIAGILAHELGHIIGNHVKSRVTRTAVSGLLAALGQSTGRENANALLAQVEGVTTAGFSRQDEKEADIIGATLLHKAGFDTNGLIRYFEYAQQKRNMDLINYQLALSPLVTHYNTAVANYQANLNYYNQTQDPQAYYNATGWTSIANQYAAQINMLLAQYQNYLAGTNPLYMTHPPEQQRMQTIALIRMKELNKLSEHWLAEQDPQAAYAYQIIQARSPKG